MKKKLAQNLAVFFFLETILKSQAQDIHFSQYNFAPLTLNPALTSAYKDLQATLHYKDQWKSLNGYRTAAATFEFKLGQPNWIKIDKMTGVFKKKLMKGLAFGVNVFSDKAGDGSMKQTEGNLSVAYHSKLNETNRLSAGLMGGFAQRSISPAGLRWNSQYSGGVYDPNTGPGENFVNQSFTYGDFSCGLLWSYGEGSRYMAANDHKYFNLGVSLSHLNNPKQAFVATAPEQLYWKWTAHASSLFGIKSSHYSVGPSVLYAQQGAQKELVLGMLLKYKPREESKYTGFVKSTAFSLGCNYRNQDAVVPYFLFEVDKYAIGISYDTNVSGLKTATTGRGGFEIVLRFNTPSPFLYQNKNKASFN
ncbi:MAG: hypothetical protein FD123_3083 [Bacteroidetes bacterium]|nr:MAG: hypothetical protein FD123_3083 [Bacteroidota bacterium]